MDPRRHRRSRSRSPKGKGKDHLAPFNVTWPWQRAMAVGHGEAAPTANGHSLHETARAQSATAAAAADALIERLRWRRSMSLSPSRGNSAALGQWALSQWAEACSGQT